MTYWMSLFCGKIHQVDSKSRELEARRRGLVEVPESELGRVSSMGLSERRRWAKDRPCSL